MIFGGLHRSFKNNPAGMMISNAVFLVQAGGEVSDNQDQAEVDLIDFFVPVPAPGKGAAEKLLIDLDNGQPRMNEDMDMMDYQGFRFQSHLNKEGYLETLLDISSPELNEPIFQPAARNLDMETLLLDISSPELNESNFQPGARSMDMETSLLDISSPELSEPVLQPGAGSMDMETSLLDISSPELNEPILQPGVNSMDMKNPEIDRTRDGSNFRISDDLNELDETRSDGLGFCKPPGMDKIGWGMLLAKFYTRMKSCRLFMIKNIGMKLKPFLVITTVASSISMFSILCSNFLFFTLLKTTEQGDYLLERMIVQEGILEILRDLPVSSGLAIRRDVGGVEEFYSLISGSEVKLERGFIDLTSLAILAGFKFHKNMTAMGVQVIGTLLNKTVSMGDDCWGKRWSIIPKPPQCYALGDIKFGFITYNVLAGLLLRNLFPDPNVLCAGTWIDMKLER